MYRVVSPAAAIGLAIACELGIQIHRRARLTRSLPRRFRVDTFLRTRWPWNTWAPPAAAVKVNAQFAGGNVSAPRMVSPRHLQFAAAAHDSPRPLWFYFRVDGARGPRLLCELMNAAACLGPPLGWRMARPVYSPDGVSWRRVNAGDYQERRGRFRFEVPVEGHSVWIAYCYPYTNADLDRFLARIPLRGGRAELCRSEGGRPVPYLQLGDTAAPRSIVWVLARQHAGETPSSYAVEGLLAGLAAAKSPELRHLLFHVVPMVDVDGVDEGRFGKDRAPVDFNRDWCETPSRKTIRALVERIRNSHYQAPTRLVLDLHAPHHGDPACYFFGSPAESIGPESAQTQQRFLELLGEESPQEVGFHPTDFRDNAPPRGSARHFLAKALHAPIMTLEMSYHQTQSGRYLTPADYREFGLALARATARLGRERARK